MERFRLLFGLQLCDFLGITPIFPIWHSLLVAQMGQSRAQMCQLEAQIGQLVAQMGQLGTQRGQLVAQMVQLGAETGLLGAQMSHL